MKFNQINKRYSALILFALFLLLVPVAVQAQSKGSIKGKVRDENRDKLQGVTITLFKDDKEITSTTTDKNGEFRFDGIDEGVYRMTFRKPGLKLGTFSNIKVKSGKETELVDRLILEKDDSTFAFIRGSVFGPDDRSVQGAKIELFRVFSDGSTKKLKESHSGEDGQFVFRLSGDAAKYRVVVKISGAETTSKDVDVDGAEIYRIAVTLQPKKN